MNTESAEDIKKHVRIYISVFVALAALTVITVGIASLRLPTIWAVTFALLVATVKGSLVACYFMHLISEKKVIYWVLVLCLVFFVFLMFLPSATSSM